MQGKPWDSSARSAAPVVNLALLQKMPHAELLAMAAELAIEEPHHPHQTRLIIRILKERMKANGLMYGEGTLEILPDGFGF